METTPPTDSPGSGSATAFRHEALVYDDDATFASTLAPFLAGAVRRREAAVAVVSRRNMGLLRDALGPDAGEVTFIDSDTWYERPAATIAGWKGLVDRALGSGRPAVRAVGEVTFGPGPRHDSWIRYESAANDVFAAVPVWVICPYDTRRLPDRVIAGARRTHPVLVGERGGPNALYEPPDDLLRALAEPLPPVGPEPLVVLALTGPERLRHARRTLEAIARNLGWDQTAIAGLLLVVTEVAVNSLRHGGGDRRIQVWVEQAAITCEVIDEGAGPVDPLAGYRPPVNPRSSGVGLWVANQLSEWLAVEHRDGVTRVRFRCRR
ncbi:anti-sigma factor RsbA family regulatory protein [Actinoplanes sp. CA-030573]|uniref:anti-sigma factor RsbA family regulatory protein n=1 Tax=Actinoplanes sp. CA-030573 TaxID=3239898 RepID=UPI003D8A9DFD